jgi:hypothetical protein
MCRRVECSNCHKPTYTGCGMHVEQVLGDVPQERRCTCREKRKSEPRSAEPSLFRRLFGL